MMSNTPNTSLWKSSTQESVMRGCGQVGKLGDESRFREIDVCYNTDTVCVAFQAPYFVTTMLVFKMYIVLIIGL